MYRCNNRTFETITEAKAEARAALIGRAHNAYETITSGKVGISTCETASGARLRGLNTRATRSWCRDEQQRRRPPRCRTQARP